MQRKKSVVDLLISWHQYYTEEGQEGEGEGHKLKLDLLQLSPEDLSGLLCWAGDNSDTELLQLLKLCGVDLSTGDYDGRTCLDVARDGGDRLVVGWLERLRGEGVAV